jgi:hypothetical protein
LASLAEPGAGAGASARVQAAVDVSKAIEQANENRVIMRLS